MNTIRSAFVTSLVAMFFLTPTVIAQIDDTDGDGIFDNTDNCQLVPNADQRDTNGDGFGNLCDPDLDGNGVVNAVDLGIFKLAFFSNPAAPNWDPDADFNGDDIVNAIDLGRLKLYFFEPPGPVAFARWNVDADGNWSDPNNWMPVAVPNGDLSVVINRAVPVTVTYDAAAGNTSVIAVTADNALVLAGGNLTVSETIQVNDSFTLAGGRLIGARVLAGSGGEGLTTGSGTNSTLEGVTLEADLTITNASSLQLVAGLTLDGATITLAAVDAYAYLSADASQSQTLGGSGAIVFGGSVGWDTANWLYNNSGVGTLTIGPGVTVRTGTAGGLLGWTSSSMRLQGPVVANLAARRLTVGGNPLTLETDLVASGGAELKVEGQWSHPSGSTISVTDGAFETAGTWSSDGDITLSNSPATLGGDFTTASLLSVTSDASVAIAGNLDLSAQALDTDTAPAGLLVSGGTLRGGTVAGSRSLPVSSYGWLDAVTLATDVIVGDAARTYVVNGLVLASGNVVLASEGNFCYLEFRGAQSVTGSGEILFGGTTTSDFSNWIYQNFSGEMLTFGPGVTVRTDTSGGLLGWNFTPMTLKGPVVSNLPGRRITLAGNPINVEGSVSGSGGGDLNFAGTWTNTVGGTITMSDGDLALGGNWTNNGTITVTDGTLAAGTVVGNAWSNAGSIVLTNSPATLGGAFTTPNLFSITTDGMITVVGEVLNTGQTLNLDALASQGIAFGSNGGITGGTLSASDDYSIGPGVFMTLNGITLDADVTLENGTTVYVDNGLTLNNANLTFASGGSTTLLVTLGAETIDGTGELRFGGTSPSDTVNVISPSGGDITLASGITVRANTSGGIVGNTTYGLTVEGSIIAELAGRGITLNGAPVAVEGSLSIGETSTVASTSLDINFGADAALDIDIGPAGNGVLETSGAVDLDGMLNLALVGGLTPAACQSFELLDYATFSGAFAAVNGPDLGGDDFDLLYLTPFTTAQAPGVGCEIDLALLPGTAVTASSIYGTGYEGERAIDNVDATNSSWCTANNDPAPQLRIDFDTAVQVNRIAIETSWSPSYDFVTGTLVARDGADAVLYDPGTVSLTGGEVDHDVVPDTAGVRSVTFSGVTWNSVEPCLSEVRIIGPVP